MEYYAIVGMVIVSMVAIFGLFTHISNTISKFTQPLNDLKIAIETLNTTIHSILNDMKRQDERLQKHGEALDKIVERLTELETKVKLYHEKGGE